MEYKNTKGSTKIKMVKQLTIKKIKKYKKIKLNHTHSKCA